MARADKVNNPAVGEWNCLPPGNDIRGDDIANARASSATECQQMCNARSDCVYAVLGSNQFCYMKKNAFLGANGVTGRADVEKTCWSRGNTCE